MVQLVMSCTFFFAYKHLTQRWQQASPEETLFIDDSRGSVFKWWNITKARIILLFASIAVSDSRTLLSMDTPNKVNACGRYLECEPLPFFMVANCDLKRSSSYSSILPELVET